MFCVGVVGTFWTGRWIIDWRRSVRWLIGMRAAYIFKNERVKDSQEESRSACISQKGRRQLDKIRNHIILGLNTAQLLLEYPQAKAKVKRQTPRFGISTEKGTGKGRDNHFTYLGTYILRRSTQLGLLRGG